MHLALITLALCVSYFILIYLFPFFFAQEIPSKRKNPLFSLILIVICSGLAYLASFSVSDLELGNRILHIFGGGFVAFLVCFLSARDSGVRISKFQFFLFSTLIVLALGIANELSEFILQEYWGFLFTRSVNDTWLDLASNVVGIILASACFVPFHKKDLQ